MFGPLGLPELIFIMVLALLIFGPRKLPEIGRTLGRGMAEFRKASSELKRTIDTEMMREELRQNDPRNLLKEQADSPEPPKPRSHREAPPNYSAPDATIARGSGDSSAADPEPQSDKADDEKTTASPDQDPTGKSSSE